MTHPQRSADAVAGFLRKALAGRVLDVSELEAKARAAGLLAESQRITHSKIFKSAKKSLGIRSTRDGFGAGGKWIWVLPSEAAAPAIPLKSGPERGTPPTGAEFDPRGLHLRLVPNPDPRRQPARKFICSRRNCEDETFPGTGSTVLRSSTTIGHQQLTSRFTGGASL